MKTKLTSVTYLGFTAMDRRFSNAMLPWLLREIRATGVKDKLSIAIEDGCLKAYNGNFEPVIVHRLVDIVRASQVPGRPEELFYILLNEKEGLLNCFLFKAATVHENATDSNDPVTHPFNYAQDAESWYAEVAAAAHEEYRNQRAEKQRSKKRKIKSKSLNTTSKSFIMRKESDRVQRIIKITIHDLDGGNLDEISSDDASVNVQYLVTSEYDDIMTETDYLVSKIVKKLSK